MRDTPVNITAKYVHGFNWPASKAEVLAAMERNGAPEDVLLVVRSYNQERFASTNDVHQALWLQAGDDERARPFGRR
ncbi:MAG: DUF2795 domain-containing protein [Actinomycetota bacterium]|nr:DUF2795 domain-containing protein [Actinomycetota bacterium]MDQ3719800.1 DUF2795 domain-containing protein [Actinomycetota bacterium]